MSDHDFYETPFSSAGFIYFADGVDDEIYKIYVDLEDLENLLMMFTKRFSS